MVTTFRSRMIYVGGIVLSLAVGWFAAIQYVTPHEVWRERLDTKSANGYQLWVERQILYSPTNSTVRVFARHHYLPSDTETNVWSVPGNPEYARLAATADGSVRLLVGSGKNAYAVRLGSAKDLSQIPWHNYGKKDTVVAKSLIDQFGDDPALMESIFKWITGSGHPGRFNGYVPDAETAIKLARVYWESELRDEFTKYQYSCDEWKPIRARLGEDGVWMVLGNHRANMLGGDVIALIRKSDGAVLRAVMEK